MEAAQRAITAFEALVKDQPGVPKYQHLLAGSYNNLGRALRDTGELRAAIEAHRKANAALEALVKAQPDVPEYRSMLGGSYSNLGIVLRETGEPRAATEAHRRANAALEALVKARPGVPEDRRRLAASYTNLGNELSFTNEPRAAMEAHQRAIAALEALVKDQPGVPRYSVQSSRLLHESRHCAPQVASEWGSDGGASEGDRGSRGPGESPARRPRIPGRAGPKLQLPRPSAPPREQGEPRAAMEVHQRAIAALEALVKDQPSRPNWPISPRRCFTSG